MPHASYRSTRYAAPSYRLSCAAHHRATSSHAESGVPRHDSKRFSTTHFSNTFTQARPAAAWHITRTRPVATGGDAPPAHPASSVWPAAFALMLVANLAAPVSGHVPQASQRCRDPDGAHGVDPDCADHVSPAPRGVDGIGGADEYAAIVAQPLGQPTHVKSEYSSQDVLRSLGAGNAPFKNLGTSFADIYALLTGKDVSAQAREEIQHGGNVVDAATGLIPEVAMLRLPAELADVMADDIEGKPISAERIISILQSADPRVLTRPLESVLRSVRQGASGKIPIPASAAKAIEGVEKKNSAGGLESAMNAADTDADAQAAANANSRSDVSATFIEGEQTHLQGYAQQIAEDRLPPGDGARRLVHVDGHLYLRGDAGYYLATPGQSEDHWLIDAPRRTLAQVPVTYDPETGEWTAHAPLRLCGGGCGSSRVTTPDSIALNRHEVDAVLSHLRDDDVQNAILAAYSEMARMKLKRTNRPDLRQFRDYSIIRNRDDIRIALDQIPPDASLFEQQRLASLVTASHYRLNPATEAFCQENAEILFHFLVENGIHGDCIRMITIHPKKRAPHALVLYTESDELIDALELSTPVIYEAPGVDGISGNNFAGLIMGAQDTTVLLDPWSRVKAVGFALTKDPQETRRVLDAAFVDIGHRPGDPYTVSLTRPLGPRRSGVSRQPSLGSTGTVSGSSSSGRSSGGRSSSSSLEPAQAPGPAHVRTSNEEQSAGGA